METSSEISTLEETKEKEKQSKLKIGFSKKIDQRGSKGLLEPDTYVEFESYEEALKYGKEKFSEVPADELELNITTQNLPSLNLDIDKYRTAIDEYLEKGHVNPSSCPNDMYFIIGEKGDIIDKWNGYAIIPIRKDYIPIGTIDAKAVEDLMKKHGLWE